MLELDKNQKFYAVTEGTALRVVGREFLIPGSSAAIDDSALSKVEAKKRAEELNVVRQTGKRRLVPKYGIQLTGDSMLNTLVDHL